MKNHIIKIVSLCLVILLGLIFVGCEKDSNASSSAPSTSKTESTVSVLLPVKATFPKQYTLIKSSDGTEYDVKGNTAFLVENGTARQYDPLSLEGLQLEGTFTIGSGLGIGSSCTDFMKEYGITRGYYSSLDKDGKAVDPAVGGDKNFTVTAILSFDEDTDKLSYVAGGKVLEHLEGLYQGGGEYLKGVNIGKDLLVVTINAKGDLTVDSFDITHYIF